MALGGRPPAARRRGCVCRIAHFDTPSGLSPCFLLLLPVLCTDCTRRGCGVQDAAPARHAAPAQAPGHGAHRAVPQDRGSGVRARAPSRRFPLRIFPRPPPPLHFAHPLPFRYPHPWPRSLAPTRLQTRVGLAARRLRGGGHAAGHELGACAGPSPPPPIIPFPHSTPRPPPPRQPTRAMRLPQPRSRL